MRALFLTLPAILALTTGCAGEDCTTPGGKVIPHGESALDDEDCNTCTCDDGALSCTEMACPDSGDSDT